MILAQKSIALNPNHPAVYLGILGNACRLSGHIDERLPPSRPTTLAFQVLALSIL